MRVHHSESDRLIRIGRNVLELTTGPGLNWLGPFSSKIKRCGLIKTILKPQKMAMCRAVYRGKDLNLVTEHDVYCRMIPAPIPRELYEKLQADYPGDFIELSFCDRHGVYVPPNAEGVNLDVIFAGRQDPKNILIMRDEGAGDVIMSIPALRALKKKYPNSEITYATRPTYFELLYSVKEINNVVNIHEIDLGEDAEWDLCINWCRAVEDYDVSRNRGHRIDSFAGVLGISLVDRKTEVHLTSEHKAAAIGLLGDKEGGKKYIALVLQAAAWNRTYPPYLSKQLVKLFANRMPEAKMVLLDYQELMGGMFEDCPNAINLCGKTKTFLEAAAVAELCDLMITPDTGLAHAAGALGIPTIVMCCTIPAAVRFSTYKNFEAIETAGRVACSPCWDWLETWTMEQRREMPERGLRKTCRITKDVKCQKTIAPIEIFDRVAPLLNRAEKQKGKQSLKWHDNNKIKVLLINPQFDSAGVAKMLCDSINKYSDKYTARQVIGYKLKSFQFPCDLVAEDYTQDEWESFISTADILHFNHGFPSQFLGGGFPWYKFQDKRIIYHSHSGWEPGKCHGQYYADGTLMRRIGNVDALLSCSEADAGAYPGSRWLPNCMPDHPELEPLADKSSDKFLVSHSPSNKDNKSTKEFENAIRRARNRNKDVEGVVLYGLTYDECLREKRKTHLFFDNLWQGYHGMSSFEAMRQGIPAMAKVDEKIVKAYEKLFGSCPIIFVDTEYTIFDKIDRLANNRAECERLGREARAWMDEHYTNEKIVKLYEDFYDNLKKKPKPISTSARRESNRLKILLIKHRANDLTWVRGKWVEKALRESGHDITVCVNERKMTTDEIVAVYGNDFDFGLVLAEYSCPKDIFDGKRNDKSFPLVIWTDDSVVWDTQNQRTHEPHWMGKHYRLFLPHFDAIFELFPQSLPMIRDYARGPVFYLPHTWEPSAWPRERFPLVTDCIIAGRVETTEPEFTGEGWYTDRGRCVDGVNAKLSGCGAKVTHYFSKTEKEWTRMICGSKIVLNKSLKYNINARPFEITGGAGRFLLTDNVPGVAEFFEDGKHLALFDSPEHAAELIKYYLSHETEREKIAAAGHDRCIELNYTYLTAIEKIISETRKLI